MLKDSRTLTSHLSTNKSVLCSFISGLGTVSYNYSPFDVELRVNQTIQHVGQAIIDLS